MDPDLEESVASENLMLCQELMIVMPICCLFHKVNKFSQSRLQATIRSKHRQLVPTVTGVGPLGQTMACLEMLARVITMFRSGGTLSNVQLKTTLSTERPRPGLLGNLATAMGFTGTLVNLPDAQSWHVLRFHALPGLKINLLLFSVLLKV